MSRRDGCRLYSCYDPRGRLIGHCDELGIRLVGPRARADRAPHIYVLDLPGEGWLDYLAAEQVRISPERDGIRVSFGLFNTEADIDRFAAIVKRRLRSMGISASAA